MEISPQRIRTTQFKTVKRGGYDTDEVQAFIAEVADALERAQNEATAMEARARAAIARLQELSASKTASDHDDVADATPGPTPAGAPASQDRSARSDRDVSVRPDEAETISRTLILAQRTADQAVAEAKAEADRLRHDARQASERLRSETDAERTRILEQARTDGYSASEEERTRGQGEVQSLLARRDFLESDVDHLEQFLTAQRERLRDAIADLANIVERVPGGLGEMRRPLLSAAGDSTTDAEAHDDGDDDPFAASVNEAPPPSEERLGGSDRSGRSMTPPPSDDDAGESARRSSLFDPADDETDRPG